MLYVHLDTSGGLIACGFYQLKAAALAPLRDRMLDEPQEFAQVLQDLAAAGFSLSPDDKLTKMPRGYEAYSEHEYADYLKLKSLVAMVDLPRSVWLEGDPVDHIVAQALGCASLLEFGRAAQVQ